VDGVGRGGMRFCGDFLQGGNAFSKINFQEMLSKQFL
jgi:hypothetical protein